MCRIPVTATALLCFLFTPAPRAAEDVGFPALSMKKSLDLTGDGKKERVELVRLEGSHGAFELRINGKYRMKGQASGHVPGFHTVDASRDDPYTEIVVWTDGPSGDPEDMVYRFDGQRIRHLGDLLGNTEYLGNGIVYATDWTGSWMRTEKYVLSKSGKLQRVPQELYHVGVKVTVGKRAPLYGTREAKRVIANLAVGSKVTLVAEDDKGWLLIKSQRNLLGWMKFDRAWSYLKGIPAAD